MKDKKFRVEWLPFRTLRFDDTYQRARKPGHVRKLKREWDLGEVGAITVSIRHTSDGLQAFVIDGQHRVSAALELGLQDTKVLCHIYEGLTLEQEARKFLALNDSKTVDAMDQYKAGLVANDPVCLGMREILASHSLRIGTGSREGTVACVDRLRKLYERDPALLDQTCAVIVKAWGTRPAALEHTIFSAVGFVLGRFNGELDRAVMAAKLAKYRGGPAALLGDARGLSDWKPITVRMAAAEIIRDTYNQGRRAQKLPAL